MKRISRQVSVTLSLVSVAAIFALITLLFILLPTGLRYLDARFFIPCLVWFGIIGAMGYVCATLLGLLLWNIRKGKVFTAKNTAFLRAISWLCFSAGLMLLAAMWHTHISVALVGFAALFCAVLVRVILNAFEEAIALKDENDLTI